MRVFNRTIQAVRNLTSIRRQLFTAKANKQPPKNLAPENERLEESNLPIEFGFITGAGVVSFLALKWLTSDDQIKSLEKNLEAPDSTSLYKLKAISIGSTIYAFDDTYRILNSHLPEKIISLINNPDIEISTTALYSLAQIHKPSASQGKLKDLIDEHTEDILSAIGRAITKDQSTITAIKALRSLQRLCGYESIVNSVNEEQIKGLFDSVTGRRTAIEPLLSIFKKLAEKESNVVAMCSMPTFIKDMKFVMDEGNIAERGLAKELLLKTHRILSTLRDQFVEGKISKAEIDRIAQQNWDLLPTLSEITPPTIPLQLRIDLSEIFTVFCMGSLWGGFRGSVEPYLKKHANLANPRIFVAGGLLLTPCGAVALYTSALVLSDGMKMLALPDSDFNSILRQSLSMAFSATMVYFVSRYVKYTIIPVTLGLLLHRHDRIPN